MPEHTNWYTRGKMLPLTTPEHKLQKRENHRRWWWFYRGENGESFSAKEKGQRRFWCFWVKCEEGGMSNTRAKLK